MPLNIMDIRTHFLFFPVARSFQHLDGSVGHENPTITHISSVYIYIFISIPASTQNTLCDLNMSTIDS